MPNRFFTPMELAWSKFTTPFVVGALCPYHTFICTLMYFSSAKFFVCSCISESGVFFQDQFTQKLQGGL